MINFQNYPDCSFAPRFERHGRLCAMQHHVNMIMVAFFFSDTKAKRKRLKRFFCFLTKWRFPFALPDISMHCLDVIFWCQCHLELFRMHGSRSSAQLAISCFHNLLHSISKTVFLLVTWAFVQRLVKPLGADQEQSWQFLKTHSSFFPGGINEKMDFPQILAGCL